MSSPDRENRDSSPASTGSPANNASASREAGAWELPLNWRYPILSGALAGLALRLVFSGDGGSRWSAMAGSFIFGAPIVVGMLTVYLAERQHRRPWSYYVTAPLWATSLFVAGTLALWIEGWICAIVIIPMFAVLGSIGGVCMGALCRMAGGRSNRLHSAAALPVFLMAIGTLLPTPSRFSVLERSIRIEAPPVTVWQVINDVDHIQPEETRDAIAGMIGVPMPRSGATERRPEGAVRVSRWGKRVQFEEQIEVWNEPHFLRWRYRFGPDSFPRNALDDHVVIGGHYFDLLDTTYELHPVEEGRYTQLTTRTRYRISTQFNFYADWVAQLLIGNLNHVGLRLYKSRSEAIASAGRPQESQR